MIGFIITVFSVFGAYLVAKGSKWTVPYLLFMNIVWMIYAGFIDSEAVLFTNLGYALVTIIGKYY